MSLIINIIIVDGICIYVLIWMYIIYIFIFTKFVYVFMYLINLMMVSQSRHVLRLVSPTPEVCYNAYFVSSGKCLNTDEINWANSVDFILGGSQRHLSNEKKPLFRAYIYIHVIILPSYVGIIINHYKL